MLVGVQDGPVQLKWIYRLTFLLIVVYLFAYAIWASNNLGVNLDDQNNDRYSTLEFFRLAKIGIDIVTPFLTLYYLYNNLFRGVRLLHCWVTVLVIALQVACLVWFVIDILDCANVAHCDGDGAGPLGYDIAFWVVVVTLVIRLICNIIFLWINFYIKRRVEVRNILDYYANPNRQPIYSGDPVASLRAGAFPDNFINSEMHDGGETELDLVGSNHHRTSSRSVGSVAASASAAVPLSHPHGYTALPTTTYMPRFRWMGRTVLEERKDELEKQG